MKVGIVLRKEHWDFRQRTEMEWKSISCSFFVLQNLIYDSYFSDGILVHLSSDYQDTSSIDKDFEEYINATLFNLYQRMNNRQINSRNWLIWDDYGIEMYDNINLIPVKIDEIEFEKDKGVINNLKESTNSRFYLLNRKDCKYHVNAILRIRKRFDFFESKAEQGFLPTFTEWELYEKLTANDFKSRFNSDNVFYREICQYVDFKRNGIMGSTSDNVIDVKEEIGSDYYYRLNNHLDSVYLHIKINGRNNLINKIKTINNRKSEHEEKLKRWRIEEELKREEARLEKFRYNKRNSHRRDYYISFDEANHKYTVDGKILQSVTNIVENCFPKFDAQLHAKTTAAKMGMTEEEVIAMWEGKGKESRELGTAMHQKIESYYQGKDSREDDAFRLFKVFADKVKLEPYRTEWAVYDTDYNIAGTIDFVDYQDGKYTIYDWKRSDKIIANGMPVKVSKYQEKGLYPLEHLENCAYYHYALQLSLYKFILEKNYDIKVSDLRLGIFHPSYDKPYVLKMPYLESEVKTLMELRSEVIL